MLEGKEERKKYVRRNRNSGKVGKKMQEERDRGCFMLKARWVEYSQELWINTGTSGLLDTFGFIQLVLPKHMKML